MQQDSSFKILGQKVPHMKTGAGCPAEKLFTDRKQITLFTKNLKL